MTDLVYRLRKRAEIRRQIPTRKSVQEGQPDRIADLLEEAADALEKREWVGLTDEDIYRVIEENIPPQLNTLFDMAKWVSGVVEAKLKENNT